VAEEMRKEGFIAADPNGNGLCSLAELETFVLKYLVAKYPKSGKGKDLMEPGKDLFTAFRPCYMRAFADAKDYKADTGEIIAGTKDATDDDFVSWEEFRLFCVYLIVYAAMFDAFAKIDGGGSGRDANDDLRIELHEWMKGYKGVTNHGFVALDALRDMSPKEVKVVFTEKIDDNGGGIVLLDEWCEFIKAAEIDAGTEIGNLLNSDEDGGVGNNYSLKSTNSSPGQEKSSRLLTSAEFASRSLLLGDLVEWMGEDEELPPGSLGVVRSVFGDGEVEVSFGHKNDERVYTFAENRLLLVPSLHVGDLVEWLNEDEDLPRGTVGVIISVFDETSVEAVLGSKENRKVFSFAQNRLKLVHFNHLKPEATASDSAPKSLVEPNSFGLAVGKGKHGASKEFFQFQSVFEPLCSEMYKSEKKRKAAFLTADPNGNGLCSLAELETFVLKYLIAAFPNSGKGKDLEEPGKDLFKAFRPCYMRAFTDAKDYKADTGEIIAGTEDATDDDFVSWEEFRLFCVYLIVYAAMFDAFAKIDGGGAGRDAGDDLRIELREWLIGYKSVSNYGFVALEDVQSLTKKEATKLFNEKIDDNGGGIVLLDEWCEFIKAAEAKAGSDVGLLLSMDEGGGVGTNFQLAGPAQVLGKGIEGKSATPVAPKPRKRKLKKQKFEPPPKLEATPNAFGLAVAQSKKWGASKEFFDFQAVFEPLCAETPEGEVERIEGFLAADPNGNGLCSLAELETFVLKALTTKYPKSGKGLKLQEPGKDLFKAFRPCYIRAFTDAKDYKADSGAVIAGTKNATDDDFVSWEEFRIFCIYLIVYAAMYDAFAKIDGGGSGRDAGDDLRIEMKEWLNGYTFVANHGFIALQNIGPKKEARAVFNEKIDDNGGGIVLLDEWCEFIKKAEIDARTQIGVLLNLDEEGGVGTNFQLSGPAQVLGKGVKGKKKGAK
jgi:hypothetical protein